ncbi:MAG: glycosyltransferase family 39 protein [Elusimicrobiota bacterium]|nr:glycosyltransferase family 39 protein [Elusimicrobiota bacterium]
MGLCLYLTLSLFAFIRLVETRNSFFAVLSGIFSGFALGTKYTAAMGVIPILILMLIQKVDWKGKLKNLCVYTVSCLMIFSPWILKNLFYTGNPFFPFFQTVFGSKSENLVIDTIRGYISLFNQYGMQKNFILELLEFPFALITQTMRFAAGFDVLGELGWAVYVFSIPALLFVKDFNKTKQLMIVYFLGFFLIWFSTKHVLRFLIPTIPVLCLLCADGLKCFSVQNKLLNRTIVTVFLGLITFSNITLLLTVFDITKPFGVAFGIETKDEYLSRKLDYYKFTQYVSKLLDNNSKILILGGEQRSYYYKKQYVISHPFGYNFYVKLANVSKDSVALHRALTQQKYTHLVVNLKQTNWLKGYSAPILTERGKRNHHDLMRKLKPKYKMHNICLLEL